jgi:hypothetical protein
VHNFWQDLLDTESRSAVAQELECHYGGERSLIPSTVPPTSEQSKPSDTPTTVEVWTNDSNTLQGQHFR